MHLALGGILPLVRSHRGGTVQHRVNDLLDGFLLTLQASGRSSSTVSWYRARLERLVAFAGDTPADRIGADLIRRWLLLVKNGTQGPVRDSYVEQHRKAAGALFTWAVREGVLKVSPMVHVARYKIERREIRTLSPADVGSLIAASPARTAAGIRDRAIIAFLFDTGVRCGELVAIDLADLELERGICHVRGKSKRERSVPLSVTLRRLLLAYVTRARPAVMPYADSGRLFLGRRGEPLQPNGVSQMIRRLARRAGLERKVSPHTFRHSFATEYLRAGGDEFTLQAILGHRTADMVRRYVHLASSDVAERHRLASPLERVRMLA